MAVAYNLEAPDGGWGILVCVGMAMPFISALAALPSFGLIFGDFLKHIGAETSAIAFITSTFFCAFSFAGLFSGLLFRRFALRTVGFAGGLIYFLGSVLQVFVTSVLQLTFAFGVIQGVGFGLIVPTSYTTFNNYFVKNRVMWMSFAQSLIGLGSMLYPIFMEKMFEVYGFRGCLLLLAGINAHALLGMLLMQPVEWHMRHVPIQNNNIVCHNKEEEQRQEYIIPLKVVQETPLLKEHEEEPKFILDHQNHHHSLNITSASTQHSRVNSRKSAREAEISTIPTYTLSTTSLGNWSCPVEISDASPDIIHIVQVSHCSSTASVSNSLLTRLNMNADQRSYNKKSIWKTVVDFLDLTLIKQPIYVNIVLGISFALYSDIAFFTLQPIYLFELGFSKLDTATIIASGAAADLSSRIFLALSAVFVQVPSRYIYLSGALFTVIARFAFNSITDFMGMVCITAIMGFLRTWIHVPLPLVFADYLPKERFANGYGLFMFLQGNIMFAISPIIGYVRDTTKNYILTFNLLNLCMGLCVAPWLLEVLWMKFCRRNKIIRDYISEHIEL